MARRIFRFPIFSIIREKIRIRVSLRRFDKQYKDAQYALDGAVMTSMIPFMPMVTGQFIDVTRAASAAIQGSGRVVAGRGPQARFLYEGKVMVDPETGSPWARKGAKKIVTNRRIQYSKTAHPKAQDHWFIPAKMKDLKKWKKMVKRIAGGGRRG